MYASWQRCATAVLSCTRGFGPLRNACCHTHTHTHTPPAARRGSTAACDAAGGAGAGRAAGLRGGLVQRGDQCEARRNRRCVRPSSPISTAHPLSRPPKHIVAAASPCACSPGILACSHGEAPGQAAKPQGERQCAGAAARPKRLPRPVCFGQKHGRPAWKLHGSRQPELGSDRGCPHQISARPRRPHPTALPPVRASCAAPPHLYAAPASPHRPAVQRPCFQL